MLNISSRSLKRTARSPRSEVSSQFRRGPHTLTTSPLTKLIRRGGGVSALDTGLRRAAPHPYAKFKVGVQCNCAVRADSRRRSLQHDRCASKLRGADTNYRHSTLEVRRLRRRVTAVFSGIGTRSIAHQSSYSRPARAVARMLPAAPVPNNGISASWLRVGDRVQQERLQVRALL